MEAEVEAGSGREGDGSYREKGRSEVDSPVAAFETGALAEWIAIAVRITTAPLRNVDCGRNQRPQ
jgi:hypothetical protein